MSTTVTRGLAAAVAQPGIDQRVAGGLAALGGVLYTIAGLRLTGDTDVYDTTTGVLALLWCLGSMAGLVGIMRLGVAGRGLLGRAAMVAALAGIGCAVLAWLTGFDNPPAVDDSAIMNAGRILRLLGFLGLGIAAIQTRRWTGWRRLTPFVYPFAIVLGGLSSGALGVELTVTLIGLAWVGMGCIIATSHADGDGRVISG